MNKGVAHILMLFTVLLSAVKSVAQSSEPDVVCVGSTKNYFVNVRPGSSYCWKVDGVEQFSTTNSVDIKWNTLGIKTLTVQEFTKDNCAGLVQSLQVTVNKVSYSKTTRKVCPLQLPFMWNGISCPLAGTYRTTFTNAVGCDSIAEFELCVEDPLVTNVNFEICKSELPYTWNNNIVTNSGTYVSKYATLAGCDSIVYANFNVLPSSGDSLSITICKGETCMFEGRQLKEEGIYYANLQDNNGCDSIVKLNLTVAEGKLITKNIVLFSGQSYTKNGTHFTSSGSYSKVIKSSANCTDELITELTFIDVPNTITPNGDEINDVFMKGFHVKIYNRNGILLFEGDNGWDGTYKGKVVSKDTYFYVLFNADSSIKPKEGYLTVLR